MRIRRFFSLSLFTLIIILFSCFSVSIYPELIPYNIYNFSNFKDFKDDNISKYRNFDLGIELNYHLNWNITYESSYEVYFSLMEKDKMSIINTSSLFDMYSKADTPSFVISYASNQNASLDQIVNQTISDYDYYYYYNFTLLNKNLNLNDTDWLTQLQQDQPSAMLNYSYVDSYSNTV